MQLPSLMDMVNAIKAKKCDCENETDPERRKACECDEELAPDGNPGARPPDAAGSQRSVSVPGEEPIQAQPVAGPAPQYGGYNVTIGQPQIRRPPQYNVSVGDPRIQQPPRVSVGQPTIAPGQQDPRAAQVRQLMAQGMSYEQAMRRVQGT